MGDRLRLFGTEPPWGDERLEMFTGVVISENLFSSQFVQQVAVESRLVLINRTVDGYPSPYELAQVLRSTAPDILFIDLSDSIKATECIETARGIGLGTIVVGFGRDIDPQFKKEWGVDAFLPAPLDAAVLAETVRRRSARSVVRS